MIDMNVNFPNHECSSKSTEIFIQTDLRCMLETKDSIALDRFFPFMFYIYLNEYVTGCSTDDLAKILYSVYSFNEAVCTLFGPRCERGLSTLNVHLLEPFLDCVERFRTFSDLSASPYVH